VAELDAIRADLPALASLAYLNTGTEGPLPAATAQAMREAIGEDEVRGRISGKRFEKMEKQLDACRAMMGEMVGVAADRIALTGGTVDGLRAVLERVAFTAGDRVVTTDLEHPAALEPLREIVGRHGLNLETVAIGTTADDQQVTDAFARALAPGARLLLVSHVAYSTGRVLPLAAISRHAREAGAIVLADGAQAVGAIGVDIAATGADFYAFPGQKWLLGPEGAGALAVAPGRPDLLGVAMQALERGTASKPIWAGMLASLAWRKSIGSEAERAAAIRANAAFLRQRLEGVAGVEIVTPRDSAGLVTVGVRGVAARILLAQLGAKRLAARDVPGTEWVRISCGFFNERREFEAVAETFAEAARGQGAA